MSSFIDRRIFCLASLLVVCLITSTCLGQNQDRPTAFWPDGLPFDKQITTPEEYFGFDVGQRHLRHDQVAGYMRLLAEESNRIEIQEYGRTHGRRPLLLLTITSPANHKRIDDIRQRHRALTKAGSEDVSINDLPVVMNMGYGVHGDEASATNTSPLVAYYFAAAKGAQVKEQLSAGVYLLDPALNPDGFDRFARWVNTFRGQVPNPDPAHAEHNQGWPSGRTNYYWFDLNRDWLPLQHPESQSRMVWYHQWKPNVVLDFHEMGTNSTFFFQPGIPQRTNPLTPRRNIELTQEISKYHANALDKIGSLYFTQEVFDDFYMGKGSTYPDLHGAVGILFEQASSRGHIQESVNGLLEFPDTIRNQFTASLSSIRAVTDLRKELIEYKRDFYRKSLEQSRSHPIRQYVFSCEANHSRLQNFADILLQHDLNCFWLSEDHAHGNRTLPAGSLVVPAEQSEYRFLRSLVERRTQFKESIFYDVSAWTLPLAFNLRQTALKNAISAGSLTPAKLGGTAHDWQLDFSDDDIGYLIDWRDDAAPRVVQDLLDRDVVVKVARKPFTTSDRNESHSYGTIWVPLGLNKENTAAIQQVLVDAAKRGVSVTPVQAGLSASGVDMGSSQFATVRAPSVAMIIESGASAYQSGEIWHLLDHRVGMNLSLLNSSRLSRVDLDRYDTLILTGGGYDFSDSFNAELERWLRRGGTVVAVSSATSFAESALLSSREEDEPREDLDEEDSEEESEAEKNERPKFVDARNEAALRLVSGAIFQTNIDTTHPLMYGYTERTLPVFRSTSRILRSASQDVSNPAVYTESPLMAGYASDENVESIANTSSIAVHSVGGGRVILLIDNPNFRAFWHGTQRVFINSIYFGSLSTGGGGRREE